MMWRYQRDDAIAFSEIFPNVRRINIQWLLNRQVVEELIARRERRDDVVVTRC
jgi:hypothetical protein